MFFSIHNLLGPTTAVIDFVASRGFTSLCCLALLIANIGCNQDSAQWKNAAANIEEKNGNSEGAIELLQTALRMDPHSHSIKLRLANLLAENGEGDLGLTLCDEVLESDPGERESWKVRSNCLRYLGRFDEALSAYQKYCAGSIDKNLNQLNELAYFRGLAGCELDKAFGQINLGIRKFERAAPWSRSHSVPIEIRSIVSAGLISRYTDDGHLFVMDLLNHTIFSEQQIWLALNKQLDLLIDQHELADQQKPDSKIDDLYTSQQENDERLAADRIQLVQGSLSFLLATRSLIFEDKGEFELADLDRLWLKRIGFTSPQVVYDVLPSDVDCWVAMQGGEAMLDTRGFILTQMPWQLTWTEPNGTVLWLKDTKTKISYGSYDRALRDLNIAIAAAEIRLLALDSDIVNRIDFPHDCMRDSADVKVIKMMAARTVAVLRNHRRQAHLKANQTEAAEQDLLRIKELGFEAGQSLF